MADQTPPVQAPVAPTTTPSGPRAGFGRRLVAAIIDGILVSAVLQGVGAIFGEQLFDFKSSNGSASFHVGATGLFFIVSILLPLAYYGYLEGSASGQTVGKKLLGIRVVDFGTSGPIGFGRACLRWVGRIVSSFLCGLGYLWMLWDKQKQTWHDKIASTVVVPEESFPVAKWPG